MNPRVIRAHEDASVNFVRETPGGSFEARYVRRTEEYLIAYVSSQAGCDRSCRFCHLTATGQTSAACADVADLLVQIGDVLSHHATCAIRPPRININFMARGEPLLNPVLWDQTLWAQFANGARTAAAEHHIDDVRFNVSTIMPSGIDLEQLPTILQEDGITLYYSLYSLRERFRKRWLPKTVDPRDSLAALTAWQHATGNEVALHWAFIEGENDDESTIHEIIDAVSASGLRPKFNAVRYNPFDDRRGREPDENVVERNFAMLAEAFGDPASRIVPRVGLSAKASCGMFVEATPRPSRDPEGNHAA